MTGVFQTPKSIKRFLPSSFWHIFTNLLPKDKTNVPVSGIVFCIQLVAQTKVVQLEVTCQVIFVDRTRIGSSNWGFIILDTFIAGGVFPFVEQCWVVLHKITIKLTILLLLLFQVYSFKVVTYNLLYNLP